LARAAFEKKLKNQQFEFFEGYTAVRYKAYDGEELVKQIFKSFVNTVGILLKKCGICFI